MLNETESPARAEEPTPSGDGEPRGRSWRTLARDAAVLVGVAGVAMTQPVLDLFGQNPTFFVAGGYGRRQIVAFALVVAFVPALVAFVVSAVPGLIDGRLGTWTHGAAVAGLAGLFGLVLGQTLGVDATVPALLLAVLVGVGVAVAEWRVRWARQFLSYLAVGNVAFLLLFLLASPSGDLLTGVSYADAGTVRVPALRGPVVVVVLDEFPLTSLIRADGSVNEVRYPNFAALADESTWFRNAASESEATNRSVPTILTGVEAEPGDVPFLNDHPRNLFSLFGARIPVTRYEVVTDMCPPEVCARPAGHPLRQALDDASVVYQHRVLPASMREGLPEIDGSWGNFGDGIEGDRPAPETTVPTTSTGEPDAMAVFQSIPGDERNRPGQAAAMLQQIDLIPPDPSVNFVHILLPHHPYELTPWGGVSADAWLPRTLPGEGDDVSLDFLYRENYAMQAMQLGAVDQMIGRLIERLKTTGAWDDATVVVTSDHGIDATKPVFNRVPTDTNLDELLRIPLFIKAPGLAEGEVRDDPASTVDVLPSLVDLLDIETEWRFDGHSLFDGSDPGRDHRLTTNVEAAFEVADRQAAQFPRGEDWDDLAAVGVAEDLVGRPVSDAQVGAPSRLSVSVDRRDLLADLSVDGGFVPYSLRGTLRGSADRPPELVVVLNGTFAGAIGGYLPDGDDWTFSGLMANYFVDGPNEVTVFEVERLGTDVVVHPVPSG